MRCGNCGTRIVEGMRVASLVERRQHKRRTPDHTCRDVRHGQKPSGKQKNQKKEEHNERNESKRLSD